MSLMHSPGTHKSLIARIPAQTGRELAEWFTHLESGPAFFRREERANWLADEHGICDRYAAAIVHEYEVRRKLRLFGAQPGASVRSPPWPPGTAAGSRVL